MPKTKQEQQVHQLVTKMVEALSGHDPRDVYLLCTAVLAANDVLSGTPNFTLTNGFNQIHSQVAYFSAATKEFIVVHNYLPTLYDLLLTYIQQPDAEVRKSRLRKLN